MFIKAPTTLETILVYGNVKNKKNKHIFFQLSTTRGGAAVVSVRGEATRHVRMRLRVRSRRRLAANWEPR